MLFKLKSVFVSTGHDSDKPGGKDKYLDPFWLLPPMKVAWPQNILDNKIEMNLNLFSLFVSRGLKKRRTRKLRRLEINKKKGLNSSQSYHWIENVSC